MKNTIYDFENTSIDSVNMTSPDIPTSFFSYYIMLQIQVTFAIPFMFLNSYKMTAVTLLLDLSVFISLPSIFSKLNITSTSVSQLTRSLPTILLFYELTTVPSFMSTKHNSEYIPLKKYGAIRKTPLKATSSIVEWPDGSFWLKSK